MPINAYGSIIFLYEVNAIYLWTLIYLVLLFPFQNWNFTSSCSKESSINGSLEVRRSPCTVDASIILHNRKLLLFSNNTILFYDDYKNVNTGPTSICYISDLFLGVVGPVDAAFNDNTSVHIIQGNRKTSVCNNREYVSRMIAFTRPI